jgi:RteC protein
MQPELQRLYARLPQRAKQSLAIDTIQDNLVLAIGLFQDLREWVIKNGFETETEEIQFFKEVKPLFLASVLYWKGLLDFETCRPPGQHWLEKYTRKKIKIQHREQQQQLEIRNQMLHPHPLADRLYFTRSTVIHEQSIDLILGDPKFTTARDRLVSEVMAREWILEFLISISEPNLVKPHEHNLRWTGSRAGLVELIYALQSGGVINQGRASLLELVKYFETGFQVELSNFYHVFNEIRLRKKNRTVLLDDLREKIILRMDGLDEK